MTNHSVNSHTSDDESLCEEPMMFPYLHTLDSDIELLNESEEHSLPPTAVLALFAVKETTKLTRANSAPNLITPNFVTTTLTASSFAIDTLVTDNTNAESTHRTNEMLSTLRKQLDDAQKEIADLRDYIGRNHVHLLNHGIRIIAMENTLKQLMLLQPTVQNTNLLIDNPTLLTTEQGTPTEKGTGTKVTNLGERPNTDFTQPHAKRAKTVHTDIAEFETRSYKGRKPFCSLCNRHHEGPCVTPCSRCQILGHQVQDCKFPPKGANSKALKVCFKCENTGHIKINCPLLTTKGNDNLLYYITDYHRLYEHIRNCKIL